MYKAVFATIAALGLIGCASSGDQETVLVDDGQLFISMSDISIEGSFEASTGLVTFAADDVGDGNTQVRVYVGDQTLGIDMATEGNHVIQPSGVAIAMDDELKQTLAELVAAFDGTVTQHRDELLPDRLFRVVNMLAAYPLGGEVTQRNIAISADGRDYYSLCHMLGQYNTAYHDFGGICWWCDSHGTIGQTFWMGGGYDPFGDGCLGVCGGGCSGTDYTQTCLDHDACEGHHGNSGAASIPGGGCSDEYAAATDDWLNAPNCGWHGYGPCGDGICEGAETATSCPSDCGGGMCAGACGGYSANFACWCDSLCTTYGDCCSDGSAQNTCGY